MVRGNRTVQLFSLVVGEGETPRPRSLLLHEALSRPNPTPASHPSPNLALPSPPWRLTLPPIPPNLAQPPPPPPHLQGLFNLVLVQNEGEGVDPARPPLCRDRSWGAPRL